MDVDKAMEDIDAARELLKEEGCVQHPPFAPRPGRVLAHPNTL